MHVVQEKEEMAGTAVPECRLSRAPCRLQQESLTTRPLVLDVHDDDDDSGGWQGGCCCCCSC